MNFTYPVLLAVIGIGLQAIGTILMVYATEYQFITRYFRTNEIRTDPSTGKEKAVRIKPGNPGIFYSGLALISLGSGFHIAAILLGSE